MKSANRYVKKKRKLSRAQQRRVRLCAARRWVAGYTGSSIIIEYSRHYGLSPAEAYHELRILGRIQPSMHVPCSYQNEGFPDSDDTYYLICGYSGGAPYGITWEEMGLRPYERYVGKHTQT